MEDDAKMTEASVSIPADLEESAEDAPALPPLQASARRLERLLTTLTANQHHSYSNPVKIVRRWLATSSGAAGSATTDGIDAAAAALLDPAGSCAKGRSLLVTMEVETAEDDAPPVYLENAAREVESWLISLAVRLLWKQQNYVAALALSQSGVEQIMAHFEETSRRITSTSAPSLFPLLARLYRLQSLVSEVIHDPALSAKLRAEMAMAHNKAFLRRDVDTQATLLNNMLRDMLQNSQGNKKVKRDIRSWFIVCIY
jgi:hypothetical protein